jgi:hypothetical protein
VNRNVFEMLPHAKLEPELPKAVYSMEGGKRNYNNITVDSLNQNAWIKCGGVLDVDEHTFICFLDVAWH